MMMMMMALLDMVRSKLALMCTQAIKFNHAITFVIVAVSFIVNLITTITATTTADGYKSILRIKINVKNFERLSQRKS